MSATDRAVPVTFTLAETEALAAFLAQHEALWRAVASECGVLDATEVPRALARGHAGAVRRLAEVKPRGRRVA